MIRSAMHCQSRAARHIAHLRILPHTSRYEALPKFFRRKHLMIPLAPVVPLRPRRDFKRTHILGHINSRQIESKRRHPVLFIRFFSRRKIAVPRLILRTLEWSIKADLHDLVVWPKHLPRHSHEPRMRDDLHESADRLRMNFYIPSPRTTSYGASGTLYRLPKGRHHVFSHPFRELTRERTFLRDNPVASQCCDVLSNIGHRLCFRSLHSHTMISVEVGCLDRNSGTRSS